VSRTGTRMRLTKRKKGADFRDKVKHKRQGEANNKYLVPGAQPWSKRLKGPIRRDPRN